MIRLKKILHIITFIKRDTVDYISGIDNHVEFHETTTKRILTYEKPQRSNATLLVGTLIKRVRPRNLMMEEWDDMPEFVQEKQESFAKIIIRFENENDLEDFAKLINQKLTPKTKSIWYPFRSHWGKEKNVYVDES